MIVKNLSEYWEKFKGIPDLLVAKYFSDTPATLMYSPMVEVDDTTGNAISFRLFTGAFYALKKTDTGLEYFECKEQQPINP